MASEDTPNVDPEIYEDQYLEAEDSEELTSESESDEGGDPGLRIESDSSGSEYNQDDLGEEESESEEEANTTKRVSSMDVADGPEEGEDFECVDF